MLAGPLSAICIFLTHLFSMATSQTAAGSQATPSLDALTHSRKQAAKVLSQIAIAMDRAETTERSGQLGLTRHIRTLKSTAEQLQQGKYRIVVLGEMYTIFS